MGNCIGFSNFLELCCQFKVGNISFLASGSQVEIWPFCVHPWRLRRLHPWRWDRDVWDNNVWNWRGHVDILLKNWSTVPIIILYDIGLFRGNRFGHSRAHFVRYNGEFGHWLLLWRVYYLAQIVCNIGNISESCSIATIWESPMLEIGACGAGFFRAWANLCAAMMTFSEE